MYTHATGAPLVTQPAETVKRTDYLPTSREDREEFARMRRRNDQDGGQRDPSSQQEKRESKEPDGTFLDNIESLEPVFDRYKDRIRVLVKDLTSDQRQLLGALYATAEQRGYGMDRVDAIAKKFVLENKDKPLGYDKRSVPNPLAGSGVLVDTEA